MTDNTLLSTITRLSRQNDILSKELADLKRSHKELKRKYNSLTLWKLIRGRFK